jgi:hypothetical protein
MESNEQSESRLLQLPNDCLLLVLRFCWHDPRSLFSAARAHSTLHHTAALAASSMEAQTSQRQVDSVLDYLTNHGQHIDSINLEGNGLPDLQQLPHSSLLRLSRLQFSWFRLQLQPGNGSHGLLGAGLPLKQLRLYKCRLSDGVVGLSAALALLPDMQHLSLSWNLDCSGDGDYISYLSSALVLSPQLTYLELTGGPAGPGGLQSLQELTGLQGLTRLQDLLLDSLGAQIIQASTLSGLQQVARLKLHGVAGRSRFEPGEGFVGGR